MSGGAATNSGIDFQHRVGAVVMVAMLAEVGGLPWLLGDEVAHTIELVRFETGDGIDDLVVVTDGPRFFVQAKRSLFLSRDIGSEFSSVIRQFVDQFVIDPEADDRYVLATSATASSRIRTDLRKLTEAARLNELGPDDNPLTKTECGVLTTVRELVSHHFMAQTRREVTAHEQALLFRRIHVAVLDLEPGGNVERAILTALGTEVRTVASLVWGNLIALALALASKRLSIDRSALTARFGEHFGPPRHSSEAAVDQIFDIDAAGPLPAGRELVLTVLVDRLVLAEFVRFADDGGRRLRFAEGKVEMPNGITSDVLLRCATWEGTMRVIESDPSVLSGGEVVVSPVNPDVGDPEASSWAQAHAALLADLARNNSAPLECLGCGRPVADSSGIAVEIDEAGVPHQVGLVHAACRRPTHRVVGGVLGGFKDPMPDLADFDLRTWVDALAMGQGLFGNVATGMRGRPAHIGWKPGRTHLAVGNWGVTYEDEQGTVRYVRERLQIQRMTRAEAEEAARMMVAAIAKQHAANDPWCVAEGADTFAPRSVLLQSNPGCRAFRVTTVAARELSRATIVANRIVNHYYAPLVTLQDRETGAFFGFGGAVVLITDPLRLREAIENWRAAGIDVPRLMTSILRSDDQFDGFVSQVFRDRVGVLIDPMLDAEGELVTGFVVLDLETLLDVEKRAPDVV